MKTKLALLGVVSLAFAACEKKEEVTERAKPAVTKPKTVRAPKPEPVAPEPAHAAGSEIAQAPAAGSELATPPSATAPAPAPQTALDTSGKTTEQLKAEREARMAKAREERTAQMATQMTTRFKEQDANGDGFISKEEAGNRMGRFFGQADKNADGFLDATEQQAMIQATSERMSQFGGQGGRQGRNNQGGGTRQRGGTRNP